MVKVILSCKLALVLALAVATRHVVGREISDRPRTETGKNIDVPAVNYKFWTSSIKDTAVKINFRRMAKIEATISDGDMSDSLPLTPGDMKEWNRLKAAMTKQFVSDRCATGYSSVRNQWYACCFLRDASTNIPVGFCGGTHVLELPEPCRDPEEGFDYNKNFRRKVSRHKSEHIKQYNMGEWKCSSTQISDEQIARFSPARDKLIAETSGSNLSADLGSNILNNRTNTTKYDTHLIDIPVAAMSHKLRESVRQASRNVPVFSVNLSENGEPESACVEKNLRYMCFAFCCDSTYVDSEFCSRQDRSCY